MLSYQKNSLLALLAQFKVKFYNYTQEMSDELFIANADNIENEKENNAFGKIQLTIDRNLTSIEKQIKKL